MSVHISAERGEVADIVLLPGDPLRAQFAAETFLSDVTCYNRVRGMLGFTGTWNGTRVSVQGTGMGIPSISIYANELLRDFECRTLIRIGSCGSLQADVKIRDIVIAMTASTDSSHNKLRFGGNDFAPAPDYALFASACRAAQERKLAFHAGGILSTDTFYQDDPDGGSCGRSTVCSRWRWRRTRSTRSPRAPAPEGARDLHGERQPGHARGVTPGRP
jgi:purine-nucleoside phosphorylase